jgi:diguanylate cyclase (GGDEF)-like protein
VEQLRAQVSSYQEHIEEAERQAAVDALTGVASRRILERQPDLRIAAGSPFCAVYLDLKGFKQIDDSLGHAAGDDLLKQFAGELRDSLRATDCVGRLGGDEFVVLIDGSLDTVRERMDVVSIGLTGATHLSTEADKRRIILTSAVGVAAWKSPATAEQILSAADRSMYENKHRAAEAKHTQGPLP